MSGSIPSLANLGRLREISAAVARHGFGPFLERGKVFRALGFKPKEPVNAGQALSTGRRLALLLSELGPSFVKLGQVLSSRADLLPQDIVRELSRLQDAVPPFAFEQVRAQVEAGLGRPLEEAFAEFDPEPMASASIAQVHRARTGAGIEVVVKVQRPNIRPRIEADVELLYVFARLLESVFEQSHLTRPTALVEEFEKAILGELDFTQEAANVRAFLRANAGRPHVVVPHVVEGLCCETVLTLERLEGPKITDLGPDRDRARLTKNLVETMFVQLFDDGLFHADPHPGNVLALDDDRIGLVDFGLVGRLTRPMQETLVVMSLAIALQDAGTLARLLYRIGIPNERVSLSALTADIQAVLDRYLGRSLGGIDSRSLLGDLLDLAQRYRIRIPKEYAVLGKAAVTVEGVVRQLSPDLDVLEVALPYARRLLYDRMNPAGRDATTRRLLLQVQGLASDMPAQLSQVLMDLEGGKLNVTSRAAEGQLVQLVAGVRLLAIAVFCSALALGGAFWLGQSSGDRGGLALIAGAATVFAVSFAWLVMGIRPRKLRLRK